MESVSDSTGYELRVLHAAADGVEPAVVLSAPGKKAEYLLNVPDGFSRLALEHKSTPSGRLSCILLTSLLPAATGGLGGLMLRLRHDGHGQVQVVGPSGTTAIVHSLRHICRWRHPKVFVSECFTNRPLPVFEDEYVVIVPIVDGDQSTGCPWCLYRTIDSSNSDQEKKTTNLLARASSDEDDDCSTSRSSESSSDSSETDSSPQAEEESIDLRSFSSILPQRRKRECNSQPPRAEEHKFFKQVRRKLDNCKRDKMNVFGVLPRECREKQAPSNRTRSELRMLATLRSSSTCKEIEEIRDHDQVETGNSGFDTSGYGDQARSDMGSEGGKEVQRNSDVSSMKHFDWLIHNSQEAELPAVNEEANPVFQLSPSPEKQQQDTVSGQSKSTGADHPSCVLGFVCYLRKLDRAVVMIDCNSEEYLKSLKEHPLLKHSHCSGLPFKEGEECKAGNDHLIAAVVDLSPRSIIQSRDYELWMRSLRCSAPAPHVVVKGAHSEFGFQSSLATLFKLNCIHKRFFPLPPGMDSISEVTRAPGGQEEVLDATLGMRLILQKSGTSVDYSLCPVKLVKLQEERRQMSVDCSVTGGCGGDGNGDGGIPGSGIPSATLSANGAAAAALRRILLQRNSVNRPSNSSLQSMHSLNIQQEGSLMASKCSKEYTPNSHRTLTSGEEEVSSSCREMEDDFQLVFFGTGCAEPSKKRGSSGILLQVKGTDRAMLMEAGEGVAGQFVRRFGDVKGKNFICSLECLWLSHKHGDHVLGVLSILEARRQQKEPLVVIGPQKVGIWLAEVKDIRSATGCPMPEFHFIRCQDLAVTGRFLENKEDLKQFDRVLSRLQLQSLRLVRVFHCFDAYGIIVRGKSGWSLVYSGDTRPCKPLEYAGKGCSVLIHEATFEDELIEQARQKRHCTVSEALKAGLEMRAQHVILTHFSQRYPEMVAMCSDHNQRVSVAFDGMVVPSHLLDSLSNLLPSISSVCQKVDKTKSLISDQVMDENHSIVINHTRPATANISSLQGTMELEDDNGTGSIPLAAVSLHSSLGGLKTECGHCTGESKHIRWSEESDEEDVEVEGPPANPSTRNVGITWSSDSEGEGPLQLPVVTASSRPQIWSMEIDAKPVALLAGAPPSLVMAPREANFDTFVSSVTRVSAEDEKGNSHQNNIPKCLECKTMPRRGFKKMPRNIVRRDEIRSSVNQFLKEVERYDTGGTVGFDDNGEGNQPSRILVEATNAQEAKHIRWTDSDTEL